MELTVKQFSEKFNLKGPEAHGAIKFLVRGGVAKEVKRISTGSRGRPTIVYHFPDESILKFRA